MLSLFCSGGHLPLISAKDPPAAAFPGRDAACNAASLIRDRSKLGVCGDPGSAAHHFMVRSAREMLSALTLD
jgi:hypothetical protein